MDPRSVGDVGEFRLIDRLARLVPASSAVIGIGDDAAVLEVGSDEFLLATVDMLVEHVHFDLQYTEPFSVGSRAVAANVSDIAAMGGAPTFALISLALPPSCSTHFVDQLYAGLVHEAGAYSTGIVGGNVTATDGPICVDVIMLGQVPRHELVLRSGARPGDVLVVTGSLGAAAARRMAAAGGEATMQVLDTLPAVPLARVTTARRLASAHIPHAMLDLSDGLSSDIRHLCRASDVGAVIQEGRLPISAATRPVAGAFGVSPVTLALSGGEDYELLIAMSAEDFDAASDAAGDVPLTVVGEVLPASEGVTLMTPSGKRDELPASGWAHF